MVTAGGQSENTLTLKTLKSQDNCADLGTKTLAAGTLNLLRNLNGLVDKTGYGQRSLWSASGYDFCWLISDARSNSGESVGTNAERDCKHQSDHVRK